MAGSCLWEKIEKKNRFSLCHLQATHECPQKNGSPFGPAAWPALCNIFIL